MIGDVIRSPSSNRRAVQTEDARTSSNRKNLLLLIYLRWIAVIGQVATILYVHFRLGISLPLAEMFGVIAFQIALNVVSLHRHAHNRDNSGAVLFAELLLDVAALTIQLYLSGGATNPFVSLFLLHVILGAVLLEVWATWTIVAVTSGCFVWLTQSHRALEGMHAAHHDGSFGLHVQGMFLCFLLAAVLLVGFITRINANLRERDDRLAKLERQAVEEDQIVRLGLLASGAAHELGTPLATIAVILGEWDEVDAVINDRGLSLDLREVQQQVRRCKEIVSNILLASGEARGEDARRTTLSRFIESTVSNWRGRRGLRELSFESRLQSDPLIVSDDVFGQMLTNILDNAVEASPDWVGITVAEECGDLTVQIEDRGNGFSPAALAAFGTPYFSTKDRQGAGLGLFLVVNVLRKLGGEVSASNRPDGGGKVALRLPLSAIRLDVA